MNRYLVGAVVLGAGVDADVSKVVRAIDEMRPLRAQPARKLIAISMAALNAANSADSSLSSTLRRADIARQLYNMDMSIAQRKVDTLPDEAADILRQMVTRAVIEYDAAAAEVQSLAPGRAQLLDDIMKVADESKPAQSISGWKVIAGLAIAGLAGYGAAHLWRKR